MKISIKRFDAKVSLPQYEKGAAGFDFKIRKGATFQPGEIKPIPTNIALKIPEGYLLLVVPRSSTPARVGLSMPHSMGIIDPYYCGDDNEIMLIFQNITNKVVRVKRGDMLAQGILLRFEKADFQEVKKLSKSKRNVWRAKHQRK